jgi:hypothetical protein
MTPKTRTTTTALILAAFALVGLTTTGAVVPPAFAQVSSVLPVLDRIFPDGGGGGNATDGADGTETETETETTNQSGDQSETNLQTNSLDQDQTAAINEEIASGEGSDVASNGESSAEANYKTKSKHDSKYDSTPIPVTNTADSTGTSEVSNTGAIDQDQTLNNPTQVNDNDFGSDDSRAAVVGFDLEFEQSLEEHPPAENGGTATIPLVIP